MTQISMVFARWKIPLLNQNKQRDTLSVFCFHQYLCQLIDRYHAQPKLDLQTHISADRLRFEISRMSK